MKNDGFSPFGARGVDLTKAGDAAAQEVEVSALEAAPSCCSSCQIPPEAAAYTNFSMEIPIENIDFFL